MIETGTSSPIKFQISEITKQNSKFCYTAMLKSKDTVSFSGNLSKILNKNCPPKTFLESIKKSSENITCHLLSCVKIHRNNDLCAGLNLRFRYLAKEKANGNLEKLLTENPAWAKVIDMMDQTDAEFKKLPKSIMKSTVYRGLVSTPDHIEEGIKVIQNAKIGDIIVPDHGYAYASKDKAIGEDYAFMHRLEWKGPRVLMEIVTPRGTQLSRNYRHLKEVVFPRNAQYQIINKMEENGITKVVLKYILPKQ